MARTAVICHSGPESDSHSGPVSGVGIEENIRGNASERIKSLAAAVFFHFVDAKGTSYGADVGRKLKFAEINISGSEPSSLSERRDVELAERQGVGNELSVETVFEVVVDRGTLLSLVPTLLSVHTYFLRCYLLFAPPPGIGTLAVRALYMSWKDMCNIYGSLHGGCAAYLVDP